jgi:AraC-like DNA-binding protein
MMAFLHNLKSVFHVLIIFQCLVFSIFLLSKKSRRRGSALLALFLIAVGLSELGGVFLHFLDLRRILIDRLPQALYLNIPISLLAAPLLYLFIVSVVDRDFRLRPRHVLHLVPFLFYAVLVVVRFQARSPEDLRAIVEAGGPINRGESLVHNLVYFVQWLGYGLACFSHLRRYRSSLRDFFSSVEPWNLGWLNFLLIAVLVTRGLEAVEYGLWYATEDPRAIVLYYAAQVLFLVFLTLLFFKSLNLTPAFQGVIDAIAVQPKYRKTLLADAQREAYARTVARVMEDDKPYLDPLLSLGDLAKKTLIPAHYLSQVLNSHFGMNFFDFVNSYRIRESRRLLAETGNGPRTILDVLLESGFNSKSVFNAAFKKHTGLTPSAYKKSPRTAAERVA